MQTSQTLSQAVDQKMVELQELFDAVAELGRDLSAMDVPSSETTRSHM
jgi:uncharacterized protein YoxC